MAKKQVLDFTSVDASTIVDCIMNNVITVQALHSFRNRCPGGAAGADKLYPHTKEAIRLLKQRKKMAKDFQILKDLLKPYNAELAKGRNVLDIIQPIITAWRLYYADKGLGLMDSQILLLLAIQSGDEYEELTGKAIPDLTTAE